LRVPFFRLVARETIFMRPPDAVQAAVAIPIHY